MPSKLNSESGSARGSGAAAAAAAARPSSSNSRALRDSPLILERYKHLDTDTGTIKRKRSVVEGTQVTPVIAHSAIARLVSLPVFGPDTLETALLKRERAHNMKVQSEYARRLEEECRPYHMEAPVIRQRIRNITLEDQALSQQIKDLQFLRSYSKRNKRVDTEQLHQYMLEHLQKQEELMRLRDRLSEIRRIVKRIYKQYETQFDSKASEKLGGSRSRRRPRLRKAKTRRRSS